MTIRHLSQNPHFRAATLLFVATASALTGCGGSSKDSETPAASEGSATTTTKNLNEALEGSPDWVRKDCRGAFPGKTVLCGVGTVSGVSSPSLARNTAMARGRTEIARYLSVEVKSVLSDYQAAKGGVIDQQIEDRSLQIAEMTLNGSRMAEYWIGKDGTYYALMALEFESFASALSGDTTLEPPLRDAIVERARKTFSSRDTEVSRY